MMRGHTYAGAKFERREERHWALAATLAVTAIAAGVSAYATYESGQAQKSAANYNKKVAENQAALATQQAQIDAETLEEKQKRQRATAAAMIGGSGVDTEGSPLLAMADSARQMQRDVYLTKYGGTVRAGGFEEQAGLYGMYSRSAQVQSTTGAGVSLLSSAANIGTQTYYGRQGLYKYGG